MWQTEDVDNWSCGISQARDDRTYFHTGQVFPIPWAASNQVAKEHAHTTEAVRFSVFNAQPADKVKSERIEFVKSQIDIWLAIQDTHNWLAVQDTHNIIAEQNCES